MTEQITGTIVALRQKPGASFMTLFLIFPLFWQPPLFSAGGYQPGYICPSKGAFKDSGRRKKYIYILFISKYLYMDR